MKVPAGSTALSSFLDVHFGNFTQFHKHPSSPGLGWRPERDKVPLSVPSALVG